MNGETAFLILFILSVSIIFLVILYSVWIVRGQQQTIDRLTDKLMARNYVEYKSMDRAKEEDASPPREDEPVSWHDFN